MLFLCRSASKTRSLRSFGSTGAVALLLASTALLAIGCKPQSQAQDADQGADPAAIRDIQTMTNRGDGTFQVACRDGRTQVRSDQEIDRQEVCETFGQPGSPEHPGNSPFPPEHNPMGPSECARMARIIELSDVQILELCRGALDDAPARCARDAIIAFTAADVAVQLCRPQPRHGAPFPFPGFPHR